MAPLGGSQVLWLMNNQEPFMDGVCVCCKTVPARLSPVQGRRSRSGGLAAVAYLPFNRDNLGNTDMGPIARSV